MTTNTQTLLKKVLIGIIVALGVYFSCYNYESCVRYIESTIISHSSAPSSSSDPFPVPSPLSSFLPTQYKVLSSDIKLPVNCDQNRLNMYSIELPKLQDELAKTAEDRAHTKKELVALNNTLSRIQKERDDLVLDTNSLTKNISILENILVLERESISSFKSKIKQLEDRIIMPNSESNILIIQSSAFGFKLNGQAIKIWRKVANTFRSVHFGMVDHSKKTVTYLGEIFESKCWFTRLIHHHAKKRKWMAFLGMKTTIIAMWSFAISISTWIIPEYSITISPIVETTLSSSVFKL